MRLRQNRYGEVEDNFVWDDLTRGGSTFIVTGNGNRSPSFDAFYGGVRAWSFSSTREQEFFVDFHIPHAYRPGSPVCPHFHVSAGSSTAQGSVVLGIEMTLAKGHHQQDAIFHAPVVSEMTCAIDGTAYKHYTFEYVNGIYSPHLEPDALVLIRGYRKGDAVADTLSVPLFILEFDLHMQRDRDGTRLKAPHKGSFDV